MTPEAFKSWRSAMGYSQARAAEHLGLSRQTVENYERGHRLGTGAPVEIPDHIGLACAALYHRIDGWSDNDPRSIRPPRDAEWINKELDKLV